MAESRAAIERKRREARQEGRDAYSGYLVHATCLFSTLAVLYLGGPTGWNALVDSWELHWSEIRIDGSPVSTSQLVESLFLVLRVPLLGMTLVGLCCGVTKLLQSGFGLKSIGVDFSRLNPASGFQGLRSGDRFSMVFVALVLLGALAVSNYFWVVRQLPALIAVLRRPLDVAVATAGDWLFQWGMVLGAIVLLVGFFDYMLRRWHFRRHLEHMDDSAHTEINAVQNDLRDMVGRNRGVRRDADLQATQDE